MTAATYSTLLKSFVYLLKMCFEYLFHYRIN